jgi:hypothetical protein
MGRCVCTESTTALECGQPPKIDCARMFAQRGDRRFRFTRVRCYATLVSKSELQEFEVRSTHQRAGRQPAPWPTWFNRCSLSDGCCANKIGILHRRLLAVVRNDEVCSRLITIPGVGLVVALTYRATVDVPARFRKSKSVGAVFGLTCAKYRLRSIVVAGYCDAASR